VDRVVEGVVEGSLEDGIQRLEHSANLVVRERRKTHTHRVQILRVTKVAPGKLGD
jgi:hypothetical protein